MSGANWECQSNEVIAKEILIALIENGIVERSENKTVAESIGEMYNTLLKVITSK